MRLASVLWIIGSGGSGCGGATAEAPLTVSLGIPHDQAVSQLEQHQYCRKSGEPASRFETYPRCNRPGTEWGESWVTARYEAEKLVELRRWERFSDENRAVERWNQLVTDRAKGTTESSEALDSLRTKGLLEAGTRTVKAFRIDRETIVGVYLLTPTPPQDASVLEKPVESMMAAALPVVASEVPVGEVARLLATGTPAVLVRHGGVVSGILTRFDMLQFIVGGTDGR